MEQLGSHWTDFHEIWCLSVFRKKLSEKTQVSLKSEKNKGYLTRIVFFNISLSSTRLGNASDKLCWEKTYFVFSNSPPPKNRVVYEIMRKNVTERCRPQMTIWCIRIACRITRARHTLTAYNTYCFSTATVVYRTRRNVPLYVHCLPCSWVTFAAKHEY
jgi:hypothetical protein